MWGNGMVGDRGWEDREWRVFFSVGRREGSDIRRDEKRNATRCL